MAAVAAQRRPLGALGRMGLVAGLHVAVLFVIARSLGIGAPVEVPPPLVTEIYKETRPPEVLPRIPEPDVTTTRESLVLPDPDIQTMEFETDTITGPPPDAVFDDDPSPAIPQPQIVGVRQDPRHPLSKPQYSPRIIREGGQGTIEIEVYVLPNGRVGDARVAKSTGFAELDLAAIAEAKRNWRLLPATRDGVAIPQWHRLRVTFKLNER
jgi:protein TonB